MRSGGTSPLHGVARGLTVCLALLSLAVVAMADPLPLVRDIRVGSHRDFDRLVVEVEEPVEVVRRRVPGGPWLLLEISARPETPRQVLLALPRMSDVVIEQLGEFTEIRVGSPAPRARVFLLQDPFRLVIDVADPSSKPFPVPEGATAILEEAAEDLGSGEGLPEQARVIRAPEPMPGPPELEAEPAPGGAPEVPAPEGMAPASEPQLPEPALAQTEPPGGVPAAAEPVLPAGDAAVSPPEPAIGPFADSDTLRIALWSLGALALAAASVWLVVRRRKPRRAHVAASERPLEPRSPESIHPDEIPAADDRVDLLEKRIDEEVRQRMQVEEHLGQVQEHLKLMRDRLNKLAGKP